MSETKFYGQDNPIMEIAFRDCVTWAWRNPEIRGGFEEETGMKSAKDPMSILVDEATGHDKEIAEAFIRWVIANVWGEEEE